MVPKNPDLQKEAISVKGKRLFGTVILLCVLLTASSAFAAPRVIKVGHSGNAQFPYQVYLEMWGKQIAEATNNRYVLEVYHSDLYGKQNQLIEGCQLGTRDMVMATGIAPDVLQPQDRRPEPPLPFQRFRGSLRSAARTYR